MARPISLLEGMAVLAIASAAGAQQPAGAEVKPVKIGIVTFLSGAAAGPFGVPARNGAELLAEAINAGSLPAPYATKGFGGAPISLAFIDEAGGTTHQLLDPHHPAPRHTTDAF